MTKKIKKLTEDEFVKSKNYKLEDIKSITIGKSKYELNDSMIRFERLFLFRTDDHTEKKIEEDLATIGLNRKELQLMVYNYNNKEKVEPEIEDTEIWPTIHNPDKFLELIKRLEYRGAVISIKKKRHVFVNLEVKA